MSALSSIFTLFPVTLVSIGLFTPAQAETLAPLSLTEFADLPGTRSAQFLQVQTPADVPEPGLRINVTEQLLNKPLFTPFRREGTVRESTRPAYIIDRDQIEAQGWNTVAEALRYLPGVLSEGTAGGQLGALSGQFMRGGNSSQTLILLDGRPINDIGFQGGFDLSSFATDWLEQIEVVPGGGSTLYGSDALGGVINLITRIPTEEGIQLRPVLGAGSFGYSQQGLQLTGREGSVAWAASYNRINSESDFPYTLTDEQFEFTDAAAASTDFTIEDERDNADVLYNNVHLKVIAEIGDRQRLTWNGLYLDKEFGVAGGVPIPVSGSTGEFNSLTPNFRQSSQEWLMDVTLESLLGPTGREDDSVLTAKVYLDDWQYRTQNPDGFTIADDVSRFGIGVQLQHNWQVADNQNLIYGFDYRTVETRNQTTLSTGSVVENYAGELSQEALFARYQVDFSPAVTAHVGLRQDFSRTAERSATSPAAGVRWDVTDTTTLRANFAQSFRAPLISNLEGLAAFSVEGNRDLEPERGTSFDLGFDQQLGDRGLLRFTYFNNEIDDLIAFEFGSPSTFRNIGRVRTTGLETSLNLQVADQVFFLANYTLNSPVIKEDSDPDLEGNTLSFRGADVLNLGLAYESPEGLFFGVFVRNVGDRFTNNTNTEALRDYTTLDLKTRIPLGANLVLNASWNNVLDESFQEFPGFPGVGSHVRVGLGATF